MDVAISMIPASIIAVREIAIAAERCGISQLGIAESPHLYGAAYPAVQDALAATTRLRVGPFVTNPVTMHASVHGATLASLAELHPGRVSIAMGVGDSAVTSVGLQKATRAELSSVLASLKHKLGDAVFIEMAVSGPIAAGSVPAEVDGVVLGSGMSVSYARGLHQLAEQAAGRALRSRIVLVGHLVSDENEIEDAERRVRASVLAYARHGIGRDPENRDVPEMLRGELGAVLDGYKMDAHAKVGGSNAALLDQHHQVASYLAGRYALVGQPHTLARRLVQFQRDSGIDGVSISVNVSDPLAQVEAIGEQLLPEIARLESENQQNATTE
ncbi:MAG: LLM class flavin-dependent oxidoreductase [Microbacteriaceae bacterium]